MGTVGEPNRMEGTVIGDDVNLAARVEGLTKGFKVPMLISQQVVDRLVETGAYDLAALEKVTVKGKTTEVMIYSVGATAQD